LYQHEAERLLGSCATWNVKYIPSDSRLRVDMEVSHHLARPLNNNPSKDMKSQERDADIYFPRVASPEKGWLVITSCLKVIPSQWIFGWMNWSTFTSNVKQEYAWVSKKTYWKCHVV
jgi:hypothetical protein